MNVTLFGVDVAKQVFQVCGLDTAGAQVMNKRLRRGGLLSFFAGFPPTLIALEACATAHHWARELAALGHEVRLLPPRQVKAYVWGDKTDAADAAAICAAMRDARIRPVAVKSMESQAVVSLHRVRELLVRQRTATGNAFRGLLAEFGVVAPQGVAGLGRLMQVATDPANEGLPETLAPAATALSQTWVGLDGQVKALERAIKRQCQTDARARRLTTIPGVGPITASALAASVGDAVGVAGGFPTGRHLAAWIGLTPREHSSGLKRRQGGITKRGDAYLRRLLILGAHSRMRHEPGKAGAEDPWLKALRERRPAPVAAVALAAKTARIAWAMMARDEPYRSRATLHAQPAG